MTSRKALRRERQRKISILRDGGLQNAEHFLGLRDMEDFDAFSDPVIVSIDLEVSRQERSKVGAPLVKRFGFATFDTRHLRSRASPSASTKVISTSQFSTSNASTDFLDCDITDFKECVFTETLFVPQEDLAAAITKCLRIPDTSSPDSQALRQIVLVGHSIIFDIEILQRIGVDLHDIPPVLATIDTHIMAQNLLRRSFTLGSLLTELSCPYDTSDLHNAGNDATYTLHAMLMLAIKSSESKGIGLTESENLEYLRALAQVELHECPRWKPTRGALGFYAPRSSDE